MAVKLSAWTGVKRPKKGPYPKGVINGPAPTTKRGWNRRNAIKESVETN